MVIRDHIVARRRCRGSTGSCCAATGITPDGGQITVQVTSHADTIQVEVTDTGAGIPPPDRERIFQRFTCATTRPTVPVPADYELT